jgi:hypothetical protein
MMRELRIGFVGSGGMVATHGQRLLRLRRDAGESVRIIGIHARNAEKANVVAEKIRKEEPTHDRSPISLTSTHCSRRNSTPSLSVCRRTRQSLTA